MVVVPLPSELPRDWRAVSPQPLGPGLPSGGQAAGSAECPEVRTCILGQLLRRDLRGLLAQRLFLCSYGAP